MMARQMLARQMRPLAISLVDENPRLLVGGRAHGARIDELLGVVVLIVLLDGGFIGAPWIVSQTAALSRRSKAAIIIASATSLDRRRCWARARRCDRPAIQSYRRQTSDVDEIPKDLDIALVVRRLGGGCSAE